MLRAPHSKRREGFTLIELMVTVAIIGILASIAVPAFINFQNKSRRSEAFANLAAIRDLEKSYFASYDVYAPSNIGTDWSWPANGLPTQNKRPWTAMARTAFSSLGFRPEGAVFYDYEVKVANCPNQDCFTATAYGDADGDGMLGVVQYVQQDPAGNFAAPHYEMALGVPREPVTMRVRENEVAVNYAADNF